MGRQKQLNHFPGKPDAKWPLAVLVCVLLLEFIFLFVNRYVLHFSWHSVPYEYYFLFPIGVLWPKCLWEHFHRGFFGGDWSLVPEFANMFLKRALVLGVYPLVEQLVWLALFCKPFAKLLRNSEKTNPKLLGLLKRNVIGT